MRRIHRSALCVFVRSCSGRSFSSAVSCSIPRVPMKVKAEDWRKAKRMRIFADWIT
jgi:hypothetical protein